MRANITTRDNYYAHVLHSAKFPTFHHICPPGHSTTESDFLTSMLSTVHYSLVGDWLLWCHAYIWASICITENSDAARWGEGGGGGGGVDHPLYTPSSPPLDSVRTPSDWESVRHPGTPYPVLSPWSVLGPQSLVPGSPV